MTEPQEAGRAWAAAARDGSLPGCRVFGVVRAGRTLAPSLDRLAGRPLRLVPAGGVAAVVCDDDLPTELPDEQLVAAPSIVELLAHEAVVEQLAEDGTVVPAAPGSRAPREGALAAWLAAAAPSLRSLLDRLEGRCEVGVLAWWDPSAAPMADIPVVSGVVTGADRYSRDDGGDGDRLPTSAAEERAALAARLARDPMCPTYLRRRRLRARELAGAAARADALAESLHARLAAVAEGARRGGSARVEVLLDAAYLLPHACLAAFDAALAAAVAAAREGGAGGLLARRSGARVPWRFATLRPFTADARRSAAAIGAGPPPAAP